MTHHLDLDRITLTYGAHDDRDAGTCLLEAVAWWAGKPHSDAPACVSPVLAAFGRAWNDGMRSDAERAQLRQYIPLLAGTSGDAAADTRRAYMASDWLVRVHTPAWLRLANCAAHAATLAALPAIVDSQLARGAQPALDAASAAAEAAWAAGSAGAAGDAAEAARAAARDAAKAAALAAGVAAWAAARNAAKAAGVAASNAPRAALAPTVAELQASAHALYRRMIDA